MHLRETAKYTNSIYPNNPGKRGGPRADPGTFLGGGAPLLQHQQTTEFLFLFAVYQLK